MKDQYFGDVNDYRKYGLLRAIVDATGARICVAWMLTPDDGRTDGLFTSYLRDRDRARHDPDLHRWLSAHFENNRPRKVAAIEGTGLIPRSKYFSRTVPDAAQVRREWFAELRQAASDSDLVFLDPDNGLQTKSLSPGRKNSSKYLLWDEVRDLWQAGKSLIIY